MSLSRRSETSSRLWNWSGLGTRTRDPRRKLSDGWIRRHCRTPRYHLRRAGFAESLPRVPIAIQRILGPDREREEPGVVPGSDQVELPQRGEDGVVGSAN